MVKYSKYARAFDSSMSLADRVLMIDHIQARRFNKLDEEALEIAAEGIIRHLRACARMDVSPDASAVREIIDDALHGNNVSEVVDDDETKLFQKRNCDRAKK